MTRRYWSVIESPFQKFAAWVDEEGRLLRFQSARHRARPKWTARPRTIPASWRMCSAR